MDVQSDDFVMELDGRNFYFCSKGCLEKFKTNPKEIAEGYTYDLIIVGGGPAGLTAGVYASILRMNTFLISENIGGQPVDSSKIVNYMGFDFISGPELIQKFQDQLLHHHYIDHIIDVVSSIKNEDNIFQVSTISGKEYRAHALIVATGMQRRKLNVPGEKRLLRRGVSYALSQDLPIFAGKSVAVVGGGNSALQSSLELAKNKCSIIIISIMPWTADPSLLGESRKLSDLVILDNHKVVEIKGEDKVVGVIVRNLKNNEETSYHVSGVLIAIGHSPNSSLVGQLVDLNEKNEIVITPECSTRTPGLFACGDVTNTPDKRVIIASGEGAKAALAARRYLLKSSPRKL